MKTQPETTPASGRSLPRMVRQEPQCRHCGLAIVFVRDRNFPDGSGKVWMCENPHCDLWQLYVYPPNAERRDGQP